jgi:hypothetical protein
VLTGNGAPGDGLAAPSAAWNGSSVILTNIDYLSQVDYWQSGSPWTEVPVTTSGSDVYSFPSIAWARGNAVVTAIDAGGTLFFWWQSGSTWNKETVAT